MSVDDDLRVRWVHEFSDDEALALGEMLNRVLERESTLGFPKPLPIEEAIQTYRDIVEDHREGSGQLMVVSASGVPVGQLVLTQNRLPNCRHLGEVSRTLVDPDHRGQGVVRAGLRELIRRSEELGIEVLTMDVRAASPAATIWSHLGFEVFGELPDYARVDGTTLSGLYMHVRVTDLKARAEAAGL